MLFLNNSLDQAESLLGMAWQVDLISERSIVPLFMNFEHTFPGACFSSLSNQDQFANFSN
jgi:hypothetical protein